MIHVPRTVVMLALSAVSVLAGELTLERVGHVPVSALPGDPTRANDIWGLRGPGGRSYVLLGHSAGTTFFEVTDPTRPRQIGTVLGVESTWRDMKTYVYNDDPAAFSAFAFIVTEGRDSGLQIVDLSDLPGSVRHVGTAPLFEQAHNIFIHPEADEPYAYVVGTQAAGGGVMILDIADPLDPDPVATWEDLYVHDFYAHTTWADPRFDGQSVGIAFCGRDNITFLDLTDNRAPTVIATALEGIQAYAHSGWVDRSGRYLYAFDELDELGTYARTTIRVIDLIDLTNPRLVHVWEGPSRATDHNGFVRGNHLYLANYTRGLTILDITDPARPVAAGGHDTQPETEAPGFAGAGLLPVAAR